jgi:hypothetical protein
VLSAADVRAEFDRVRGYLDHRSVADPTSLDQNLLYEPALDSPRVLASLDRVKKMLEEHPAFSQRFDFWWAIDPRSYNSTVEVALQVVLIAALADSNQDHPHLNRLKPTAVRCVFNPQFSSTSIQGSAVDFVCISSGFMKFLQVLLGTLIDLRDLGRDLSGPTRLCRTNLFFGQDAERVFRERPDAGEEVCRGLVGAGLKVLDGHLVSHHSPIFGRLMSDVLRASPIMPLAYTACEGFIACHEIAHLLAGHAYSPTRDIDQEIEADRGGASLMIVSSATDNIPAGVLFGPALFFQASRIYELIRRMGTIISEAEVPESEQQSMDDLVAPELELKQRMDIVQRYLDEQIPQIPGLPIRYSAVVAELSVLIVGCQQYLIKHLQREVLSFDAVLDSHKRN